MQFFVCMYRVLTHFTDLCMYVHYAVELTDVQHEEDKCFNISGHFTVARQPREDLLTYLSVSLCEFVQLTRDK